MSNAKAYFPHGDGKIPVVFQLYSYASKIYTHGDFFHFSMSILVIRCGKEPRERHAAPGCHILERGNLLSTKATLGCAKV